MFAFCNKMWKKIWWLILYIKLCNFSGELRRANWSKTITEKNGTIPPINQSIDRIHAKTNNQSINQSIDVKCGICRWITRKKKITIQNRQTPIFIPAAKLAFSVRSIFLAQLDSFHCSSIFASVHALTTVRRLAECCTLILYLVRWRFWKETTCLLTFGPSNKP